MTQFSSGDRGDQLLDGRALLDSDRELHTAGVKDLHQLVVLKPGVGADDDRAVMPGATHTGKQLVNEPRDPALRVRLALAVTDVQHLAGV